MFNFTTISMPKCVRVLSRGSVRLWREPFGCVASSQAASGRLGPSRAISGRLRPSQERSRQGAGWWRHNGTRTRGTCATRRPQCRSRLAACSAEPPCRQHTLARSESAGRADGRQAAPPGGRHAPGAAPACRSCLWVHFRSPSLIRYV